MNDSLFVEETRQKLVEIVQEYRKTMQPVIQSLQPTLRTISETVNSSSFKTALEALKRRAEFQSMLESGPISSISPTLTPIRAPSVQLVPEGKDSDQIEALGKKLEGIEKLIIEGRAKSKKRSKPKHLTLVLDRAHKCIYRADAPGKVYSMAAAPKRFAVLSSLSTVYQPTKMLVSRTGLSARSIQSAAALIRVQVKPYLGLEHDLIIGLHRAGYKRNPIYRFEEK